MHAISQAMSAQAWDALGGEVSSLAALSFQSEGQLPSAFHVTDMAAAAIGVAGLALREWVCLHGEDAGAVCVDRRLASMWFHASLRPLGWVLPEPWDVMAGDYRARDGWIRLHTNAAAHRAAALRVLGPCTDRATVEAAVARWYADTLEEAVIGEGGCAATMRGIEDWRVHPQGQTLLAEPLVEQGLTPAGSDAWPPFVPGRPLAGIRVLDLTRVLAGPVATRYLAGWGADVLRIDPLAWEEPALVPELTPGKRCAYLDLRDATGRALFESLLRTCDVLVHGYRPGALDRLGYDAPARQQLRPGLVDVSLDAYGWTGPWAGRRGFDSLVQMSSGIAQAGMARAGASNPRPLPVQALDQATGYLMAAAALRGLSARYRHGTGTMARLSLARTAWWLIGAGSQNDFGPLMPEDELDCGPNAEETAWGPALRLRSPLEVGGRGLAFASPAVALRSSPAHWSASSGAAR
ncbi:CoA transferase [Dyella sp.]|uniref:CoA transferase n=1 Tax=Dyella sp. TaxID=1869338 RepID=UPI002ED4D9BF